jgi:thiol-disulfide isomerase/thioredoxin
MSSSSNPSQQGDARRRRSSEQQAAASLAAPVTSSSPNFGGRMRDLVLERQNAQKQAPKKKLPSNVYTVETLEEYKKVVGDETNKVVCVRFFARWCKACKAVQPLFYHMANKFPNIKFVDVPVTDKNANLHQGLGVPSLPFGHIYHPTGGLVEEQSMNRKSIPYFALKLQSYVKGSCELSAVGDATCPYPTPTPTKTD